MSRATINTGSTFSRGDEESSAPQQLSGAGILKVAVLADLSGRASRRQCEPENLARRPAHRLRKDNFESLFEQMGVRLQLPVMDRPLSLLEFDDLHPDYLYSRVPLFRQFIELEKRLLKPAEFAGAAEEIRHWRPELRPEARQSAGDSGAQSMLDAVLSGDGYREAYTSSPEGRIDRLIKDIVAPYVQEKPDAEQDAYLQAVADAASEAMRKIMHQSDFRQLEASWRSLHLLLRRLEDHPNLELHVIDVSKEEILADFARAEDDLEQSQLFKCLVEREATAGGLPYNLIVGDFHVADDERDLHLLIDLATIAEAAGSAVVLGGDSRLAGCATLAGSPDPDDWHYPLSESFAESWRALREYPACDHLALAGPRFMLRLPYGADSATTDCFEFEELTEEHGHRYYLWGNSAYLLALSLCEQFVREGRPAPVTADRYEDLPLHLRRLPQGQWITPCAEALLNDRAAAQFTAAGFSTLRSVQGRDQILLPRLQSLAGNELQGPWS
ncbi:type VI secretion system contractile sheath domain-containing protein [Microbulbifer halophilus]|uniref:Type VI secretion system contractile sheath domain-containing protein n=1 Tax=Microbulbifer halophilus TaxID=453963 RepID=A0ABW5EEI3_9GAMM|nr:type VI secretion system contractile sheath large subunit [Microbulbifer halophilus]MCW8128134.1 type VI secretion system contractile sheath large subunit [Microbulbifer halophilus]